MEKASPATHTKFPGLKPASFTESGTLQVRIHLIQPSVLVRTFGEVLMLSARRGNAFLSPAFNLIPQISGEATLTDPTGAQKHWCAGPAPDQLNQSPGTGRGSLLYQSSPGALTCPPSYQGQESSSSLIVSTRTLAWPGECPAGPAQVQKHAVSSWKGQGLPPSLLPARGFARMVVQSAWCLGCLHKLLLLPVLTTTGQKIKTPQITKLYLLAANRPLNRDRRKNTSVT